MVLGYVASSCFNTSSYGAILLNFKRNLQYCVFIEKCLVLGRGFLGPGLGRGPDLDPVSYGCVQFQYQLILCHLEQFQIKFQDFHKR